MPSAFSSLGPQRLLAATVADFARAAQLEMDSAAVSAAACFVARRGEALAGLLAVQRADEHQADMLWLGVLPEWRRQGAATDLLRLACAWWARQGGQTLGTSSALGAPVLRALQFAPAAEGRWTRAVWLGG